MTSETGATSGATRNGTSGVASVWSFDPHALSATRQIQRIQTQIRTRQRTTVDKLKLEPMAEEAKNLKEIKELTELTGQEKLGRQQDLQLASLQLIDLIGRRKMLARKVGQMVLLKSSQSGLANNVGRPCLVIWKNAPSAT